MENECLSEDKIGCRYKMHILYKEKMNKKNQNVFFLWTGNENKIKYLMKKAYAEKNIYDFSSSYYDGIPTFRYLLVYNNQIWVKSPIDINFPHCAYMFEHYVMKDNCIAKKCFYLSYEKPSMDEKNPGHPIEKIYYKI